MRTTINTSSHPQGDRFGRPDIREVRKMPEVLVRNDIKIFQFLRNSFPETILREKFMEPYFANNIDRVETRAPDFNTQK